MRPRLRPGHSRRSATVAALVALAAVALAIVPASAGPGPGARLAAAPDGNPLAMSNSKHGVALFEAGDMFPGDPPVTGSVTIKNVGAVNGRFALALDGLRDTPGPNGGPLSEALDLRVDDSTSPSHPQTRYAGKLGAMGSVALGEIPKGAQRTYLLSASLPVGADDRYQGASTTTGFVWRETEADDGAVEGGSEDGGPVGGSSEEGGPGEGTSDQPTDTGAGGVAGDSAAGGSGSSDSASDSAADFGSDGLPFTGLAVALVALLGAISLGSGYLIRRRLR